jgi:hypothetical protein
MSVEVVTKEDLQTFRMQLLNDIKLLIHPVGKPKTERPWLKNREVMELLNISSNTVQRLRISGKLRSSKVGGVHYYRYEEIVELLNSNVD